MANVVLSFWDTVNGSEVSSFSVYFESIIQTLKEKGNNVLVINTPFFKTEWLGDDFSDSEYIVSKVKEFRPDLAIAFNNQAFPGFYDLECPITIWDGDFYSLFACKEALSKRLHEMKLVTAYKGWIKDYVDIGFKKENIILVPCATAIKKESLTQNKNISFIGTSFRSDLLSAKTKDKMRLYESYLSFLNASTYDYQSFIKLDNFTDVELYGLFDIRNITLIHLLDLGLHLYGVGWKEFEQFIPQLSYSYDITHKYSLKHNEDIYNSSKICLSISHPQTKGAAFPWRCFDIMASNGCLISSYSQDLKDITKEWVDIPMYRTPIEARDLCIKLLKDDIWRKDIVEASQNYVESNAHWHQRFKQLEDFFGVSLFKEKEGSVQLLSPRPKRKNGINIKSIAKRLLHAKNWFNK